jgi:hypothetical protein
MMRIAIALAALLAGACNSSGLPIGDASDMPAAVAESPPADIAEAPVDSAPPADTETACGEAGQPCCAEGVSWLPPSSRLLQGGGSCGDGLACAQSSCPPRSTCLDGHFNDELHVVFITYCTP